MSELVISIAVNVLLGVLLWGLLAWKTTRDTVQLSGADEALALFTRQYPGGRAATVADDGRSALIDVQRGAVGLLERHGRRWNARMLKSGDVSGVASADGALDLKLADFGWPRARIRIADPAVRAPWEARLLSLTTGAVHGEVLRDA